MIYKALEEALKPYGLICRGGFGLLADDGLGAGTLIMIGNAGSAMWAAFEAMPHQNQPDPLDHWTRRLIDEIARDMEGVAYLNKHGFMVYRPSKVITESEFRELSFYNVLELDIPFEDYWEKVRRDIGNTDINKNKFIVETVRIYTSSHCPRRCGFCTSHAFIPASQRKQSAVIRLSAASIHQLVLHYVDKYGAKGFLFSDEDFIGETKPELKRVFDFCQRIIDSKQKGELPKDIEFNCQARVGGFIVRKDGRKDANRELIEILTEAGFNSFGLGIETFSDRLLTCPSINKIGTNASDSVAVVGILLEAGLIPQINIILAIPETTVEELVHSMKMGAKYVRQGCQIAVTPLLKAIPGAPICDSKDYTIRKIKWANIYNSDVVLISDYVIPHDPEVRRIADKIEKCAANELEKVRINTPWKDSIVPKFLVGLVIFISVAKLLNRHDLEEYFRGILYEVLDKVEDLKV